MDFYGSEQSNQSQPNTVPGKDRPTGFAMAALICGILSLLALCTGIFAISFGCLGLLFVVLARRKNQPMTNATYGSMCMCLVGIFLGISIVTYVFTTMIWPMLTDPEAFRELNQYYQNIYGVSLEEMFGESLYNIPSMK